MRINKKIKKIYLFLHILNIIYSNIKIQKCIQMLNKNERLYKMNTLRIALQNNHEPLNIAKQVDK